MRMPPGHTALVVPPLKAPFTIRFHTKKRLVVAFFVVVCIFFMALDAFKIRFGGQQPMWATAMEEWALDCQIECDLPDPIPSGYLHQGQDLWLCDTANLHPGSYVLFGERSFNLFSNTQD